MKPSDRTFSIGSVVLWTVVAALVIGLVAGMVADFHHWSAFQDWCTSQGGQTDGMAVRIKMRQIEVIDITGGLSVEDHLREIRGPERWPSGGDR